MSPLAETLLWVIFPIAFILGLGMTVRAVNRATKGKDRAKDQEEDGEKVS